MDLFSPITIKAMKARNRIVLPPLASAQATDEGYVTKEHLSYYERFKGLGMVIVEHTYIHPGGKYSKGQLGLFEDGQVDGLKELAEVIRREGSQAGIQLTHAGIVGCDPIGPSPINHPKKEGLRPKEMTAQDMEEIKTSFVMGAKRAKEAGFDFIELHGAHGYLLSQFLSPLTNSREDRYGGSKENRLLFPLEVVKAVKEALPFDMPLFYRLGAHDLLEGGLTLEESPWIAKRLVEEGVDVLDISGGLGGYPQDAEEEGFFLYLADAIRPQTEAPLLITGGLKTPEIANSIIREGRADLVGVGRQLLKDPKWAIKAFEALAPS